MLLFILLLNLPYLWKGITKCEIRLLLVQNEHLALGVEANPRGVPCDVTKGQCQTKCLSTYCANKENAWVCVNARASMRACRKWFGIASVWSGHFMKDFAAGIKAVLRLALIPRALVSDPMSSISAICGGSGWGAANLQHLLGYSLSLVQKKKKHRQACHNQAVLIHSSVLSN